MTPATHTRLHISPLTPELLPVILGSNLKDSAQNITYHNLQTFPDKNYGYIDLPFMDAQSIKKKLNSAILKGKKMSIEEARPHKRRREEIEAVDQPEPETEKPPRKSKRSKEDVNVLSGHEIDPERIVKRGWTEPKTDMVKRKKDKKEKKDKMDKSTTQAPSKFSDKQELLFRTKLPSNRKDQTREDKKGKKKTVNNVVHEFEKSTTQPSFLRENAISNKKTAVEYVDGKGWVDEDGNLVEEEDFKAARRRKAATDGIEVEVLEKQNDGTIQPVTTRSQVRDSSPDGSEESEEQLKETTVTVNEDGYTSSSGSSSDSSGSDSRSNSNLSIPKESSSSSERISKSSNAPQSEVHPLEALFKKPAKPASLTLSQDVIKPSLEITTSFSFFDQDDLEENNDLPPMPATPFSSQDLRVRGVRSAAPTPDTAHPSRFNSRGSSDDAEDSSSNADELEGDIHDDEEIDTATTPTQKSVDGKQQSEFEKRFWESRGDNNRAWKARRRTVLKEKRQRENRLRRPKNW